ncbi:type II toxin-antitoxin system VapC family toxin [Nocardia cyriacigeorgica]|uniref:type II toxin-antitoxin system VapC family toxin n=1 Tax=Nocardia cyriacigeorgica TaxID=135487 RepID=UPI00189303C6|nr:PIN domain-containing protein [Nocardia cyriacigeorgica]MBF6286275.1 PIN domain-containing protein [Nocardia cyriacigeorgica]BDT89333.1 ribonuclease VapC [Nocardia cyriacigeorgica]
MTLIVDANVLVAVMNRRDKRNQEMRALLSSRSDQFIVTPYVVAEVSYLLQKYAGAQAEIQFMEAVANGVFREEFDSKDTDRIIELMRQFASFPLGAADASLIAVAERLQVNDIATVDNHFRAVKTAGLDYLNVLP